MDISLAESGGRELMRQNHTYAYVANNPIVLIDPYGEFSVGNFVKKIIVAGIVNTIIGQKVMGIGALFYPIETGGCDENGNCSDMMQGMTASGSNVCH